MNFRPILQRGVLCLLVASAPIAWAQAGSSPADQTGAAPASQSDTTSQSGQAGGSAAAQSAGSQTDQTTGATGQTGASTTGQTSTSTAAGTTGSLTGRVTAGAGAGVPNSSIIVTDVSTGQQYRALTGADGSFTVASLPPGTYRVDVETGGFRRMSRDNVVLTAGAPMRVDLTLESGDVRESVEVKAVSPVYQAETAERAIGFGTRTVRQMPIIDRNYQELIGLFSGITPPVPTPFLQFDPQLKRILNVNGQNDFANNHMLDGIDNNEPFTGVIATHVAPVENIQQMNVRTANYNAEYGRSGGAVVNVMTRPGTNEYHGSLFYFNTNNLLQARNTFNTAGDQPHASRVWNQFGGTVGGPIMRDRTFFFGGYEGQFDRGRRVGFASVPTADLLSGNFNNIPGFTLFNPATGNPATGAGRTPFVNNRIPSNQISPVAQGLLPLFPAPNQPGFENNFLGQAPFRNDGHRFNGRLDHHFTDSTMAWLRYNYSRFYGAEESVLGRAVGSGGEGRLRVHNVALTVNHNFSPNLLADVRFGYNRYENRLNPFAEQTLLGQQLRIADPNTGGFASGLPAFSIGGYQYGTPAGFNMRGVDNNFNWASNWSAIVGRHQLKFGVDFRRYRVDGFQDLSMGPMGSFMFGPGPTSLPGGPGIGPNAFVSSFGSFLLGAPTSANRTFFSTTPSYRQTQGYGWISDTLQITPRLSVDLGVRYEVYGAITPRNAGGLGNYNPFTNTLTVAGIGDNGNGAGIDTDWNNIAPRFGFAFRATSRTVVRGGYAISYFPVPMSWSGTGLFPSAFGVQQGLAGTFGQAGSFNTLPNVSSVNVPDTGQLTPSGNQPLTYMPSDMNTPYVQSYNFSVQHDFGSGTLFDVAYVGTLGRQLPYTRELNAALPGTGLAGLPLNQSLGRTASTIERGTGINNNYNSLQANLTKRFAHGLALQASYTWSKAMDFASNALPFINNLDPRANYALADYDRTHMVNFSHVWELPFGAGTNRLNEGWVGQLIGNWQINGIFRWASGTPFSVFADPTFCNCPGNMLTANVMGTAPRLDAFDVGPMSLDRANFAAPGAGSFGNLGRNALRGPAFYNYDLSLFRSFPIKENIKLEFRGEAYNLTNTPHWGNPVANLNSASFGQTLSLAPGTNNRQVNIGARLLF